VGEVTVSDVVKLLQRCRGDEYGESPHHFDRDVTVHEFRPIAAGVRWYVKGYFKGTELVLISAHRSVHRSERET